MRFDPEKTKHSGTWQTGSTRPPRSHGGLLTCILLVSILLVSLIRTAGLVQLLGLQNFGTSPEQSHKLADLAGIGSGYMSTQTAPAGPLNSNVFLELEASPPASDHFPGSDTLPLEDICKQNMESVVSITCLAQNGSSTGTGVVLSELGYIITNAHVVEGAQALEVLLTDGRTFSAAIVGTDPLTDLAVIYVEAEDLFPAVFGDSSVLQVGDAVVAMGDPLGSTLQDTMTDGIVSAIDPNVTTGSGTTALIQTNAALNPVNSGGPLLNSYGQVIGIHTTKINGITGGEGLAFAIPSTTVKEIAQELIQRGYISGRPALGIQAVPVDPFYQIYCRYPAGLYITEVQAGSDAAQKNLQAGDILLSVNEQRITTTEDLSQFLSSRQCGDTLSARVYRGGEQITLELIVEEKR